MAVEITNEQRAAWAEVAFAAFCAEDRTGIPENPGDRQDALSDLICDLMHYADTDKDLNFPYALQCAYGAYEDETSGDE